MHANWDIKDLILHTPLPVGTWVRNDIGLVGQITRRGPQALYAFSGRAGRADGLAAYLAKEGIKCTEIDTVIDSVRHDLLDDDVFERKLQAARAGTYKFGFFGTPCSTFSVARINGENETGSGPRAVRSRTDPEGHFIKLSPEERREVDVANKLVERSVKLARAIVSSGGHVLFENPPDRGDRDSQDSMLRRLYQTEWKNHAPLWLLKIMKAAKRDLNLREITFPQCALGSKYQKYTFLTNSTYATVNVAHTVKSHVDGTGRGNGNRLKQRHTLRK